MQQLKYPVLVIGANYVRGNVQDSARLLMVGANNLEGGCFDAARIVDSSGQVFSISDARIVRWTFSLWNIFKSYRKVLVELDLSLGEKVNSSELQKLIVTLFKANPSWLKDCDESEQEIYGRIFDARTIREIIESVSAYSNYSIQD